MTPQNIAWKKAAALGLALLVLYPLTPAAEDWPDFRGKDRLGVWNETGLIETFPPEGLPVVWRVPVNAGFSSPTIANKRVFVFDYVEKTRLRGIERLLALDEETGRILWTREWPADYARAHVSVHETGGPAAAPMVDGDRVYVMGRAGQLHAMNANSGEMLWSKDFIAEFKSDFGSSGSTSPPTIEGSLIISVVRGDKGPGLVAWNKLTGKEVWRAGTFVGGPAPPILITAGGRRQLIVRSTEGLVSVDPMTGKEYWKEPFRSPLGDAGIITSPVYSPPYLTASDHISGAIAVKLDAKTPTASLVWKSKREDDLDPDTLNAEVSPIVVKDGYIYGICTYGQLRCLRLATGEQIWESQKLSVERTRFVTAFIVRNGDRFFILNDRGELVIAKLSPEGYEEISRTTVIKGMTFPGNRRKLTHVQWSHPSYANRRMYVRNNEEIVAYSLAAPGRR